MVPRSLLRRGVLRESPLEVPASELEAVAPVVVVVSEEVLQSLEVEALPVSEVGAAVILAVAEAKDWQPSLAQPR